MHTRYHTEYSNQLHQLLVSVSRHFYIGKNSMLKYQQKPMEVNINNCHRTGREHLVYYIMRDHFSGNFVFRLDTSRLLMSLAEFLYLAWSQEEGDEHFRGMPESVMIPKLISSPELLDGLTRLEIKPLHPPSGFASGVRIVRDLEQHIHYTLGQIADQRVENVTANREQIYRYMLKFGYPESKIKIWQDNLPPGHPRDVPEYQVFLRHFPPLVPVTKGSAAPASDLSGEKPDRVNKPAKSGNILEDPIGIHKFSPEKLERAQDLVYEAWDYADRQKRLSLAFEALKISPYCADAYNLLAAESRSQEEKLKLYRQGVEAGRLALGDLFFKRNSGDFWGLVETRPYMRAMHGLARCLWKAGRRDEAIDICKEMLELDGHDHQGVRYLLVTWLLEAGRDEECRQFLAENHGDISCFMIYSEALLAFRTGGSGRKSNQALQEAIRANRHVPPYLLGQKPVPFRLPDYYSPGDESEAVIYAGEAKEAWHSTPGALEWLEQNS